LKASLIFPEKTPDRMKTILLLLIIPMLFCGCEAARPVSDVALGAGGGALASDLSHGNVGITAAGAAGGVALSEGAFYLSGKQAQEAYANGYDKGRSDAVKQQYWLYVKLQKLQANGAAGNIHLYGIQIPEQTIDGVILEPTTKYLRIED
jgi:hypothetical protein